MKNELKSCRVIRYVRPSCSEHSNLGGVTFVFDMDYTKRLVDIKFSVCSPRDNFNKQLGVGIAESQGPVRSFPLDDFRRLADIEGGFVDAYWSIVKTSAFFGEQNMREKKLLKVLS